MISIKKLIAFSSSSCDLIIINLQGRLLVDEQGEGGRNVREDGEGCGGGAEAEEGTADATTIHATSATTQQPFQPRTTKQTHLLILTSRYFSLIIL